MSRQRFAASLLLLCALAGVLRFVYLRADPPWYPTVGVIWHDEGAWVHNARNRALFGAWRLDEWNPVYVAPVFTALEYASFRAFGVGTWQARIVSGVGGVISVALLGFGVRRIAGSAAGLIAAGLLATNYVYVMYDRAAIMEALMTAFIVAAWWASTRAETSPPWGAAAGVLTAAAYFTKAAAAFYVGAVGLAALWSLAWPRQYSVAASGDSEDAGPAVDPAAERRAAFWTLAGLSAAFAIVALVFVLPHWSDYRFYNWQISVTRKPSYDLKSILTRVSWFPILHDQFSRMWFMVVVGVCGAWSAVLRWPRSSVGERLLLLWVTVGSLELLVHDVGNERRFVFLIPVFAALTGVVLGRRNGLLPAAVREVPPLWLWLLSPLVIYSAYVVCGPLARLAFLYEVKGESRLGAAAALVLGLAVLLLWRRTASWLSSGGWPARAAGLLTAALMAADLVQFGQWAVWRTYKNYEASVAVGQRLPAGTLVQGKLANGLSLENRIHPIFIGHGFGNFADRTDRGDVRYILTYTAPWLGYEGSQIEDVLAATPGWRIIMNLDVAETPSGTNRAALIEKRAPH